MKKIYIIQCNEYIKIGISEKPKQRLKALQTSTPYELVLVGTYDLKRPRTTEKLIHALLDDYHVRGEWFNCSIIIAKSKIYNLIGKSGDEIKEISTIKIGTRKTRRKEERKQFDKENVDGEVEITKFLLSTILTKGIGLSRSKALLLGIGFPLRRGWKKKILGTFISEARYDMLRS